jgi:holo-[acyl-carrier protein] synthase
MRMGFDLVQVSTVADSLERFGDAYGRRIFTEGELQYACAGNGMRAQRLAARFAAKEAVMKALQLAEAGVGWRDIEVIKHPGGDCDIALHGRAAEVAAAAGAGQILLSMSHDGDYAGANVCVLFAPGSEGISGSPQR